MVRMYAWESRSVSEILSPEEQENGCNAGGLVIGEDCHSQGSDAEQSLEYELISEHALVLSKADFM